MEILKQASDATGVPIPQLMQYTLVTGVLFVMFGVGQTYITNVIGVAYPAFMSFIALESQGADDDKQWLTYWVCFGAFNIVDQFAGIILSFIPFYYFLKLGFLVFLFHPKTKGATQVYESFILPYMEQYEGKINEVSGKITEQMNKAKEAVSSVAGSKMD